MDNLAEQLATQMARGRGLWIGLHTDVEAVMKIDDFHVVDPHITVAHLGKRRPKSDESESDRRDQSLPTAVALVASVEAIALGIRPFIAMLDGVARFVNRDGDSSGDPVVALIEGVATHRARARLCDHMASLGHRVDPRVGVPHVTLGRSAGNVTLTPVGHMRALMPIFNKIGVTCGDAHRRYPLAL